MKKNYLIFTVILAVISLTGCSMPATTAKAEPAKTEPAKAEPAKAEPAKAEPAKAEPAKPIVWIGDSLTQGSLGDEDDNLENAPYEKLKTLVNVPVQGFGFYGYNTHDALWTYTDESQCNQKADPGKIYIFWLGSNDWVIDGDPNANTTPVMAEIDKFLNTPDGRIKDYIVIGTTSRWRLGDLYVPINRDLKSHYGPHYMDVIDIINQYGYSEDNTHLSQASYDAIAVAVYNKMKDMGYI